MKENGRGKVKTTVIVDGELFKRFKKVCIDLDLRVSDGISLAMEDFIKQRKGGNKNGE